MNRTPTLRIVLGAVALVLVAGIAQAHDPPYTQDADRERCTFTSTGSNPYFPLWPGYALLLEGEEEDDEGATVEIASLNTVLAETEVVDGVTTRVFEERETEDGELVEISRNFMAYCRETGDVWYFGEDVDIYEDGEVVGHEGAWRAGVDGAEPGIIMPGNPLVGARYAEEHAPGVAEDQAEIVALHETVEVPAGTFDDVLRTLGTTPLAPGEEDHKAYAHGVGNVVDEVLELTEITPPPCQPDATTHCLANGRFRVTAEWETEGGGSGPGFAILPSDLSGEFWFFNPSNTELIVKVLDACTLPSFNSFWVFSAGLTNVGVEITVTDTEADETIHQTNPVGAFYLPHLDTDAFETCP